MKPAVGASLAPEVGASEIERVHGEWLVVVRCDANDVCLEPGASEIECLVGEWLVLKCRDSTAVCLERVPLKTSVYMGSSWLSSSLRASSCAMMAMMYVLSGRLLHV